MNRTFMQFIHPLFIVLFMMPGPGNNARAVYDQASELHDEAFMQGLSPQDQFRALSRASVENWQKAPASSLIYGRKALSLAREMGNMRLEAEALNNIGVAHSYANSFGEALEFFFQALSLREQLGDVNLIATTLNNIGNVYFLSGSREQAIDYYQRSLQIKQESGNDRQITSTLINLASIFNTMGESGQAIDYINRAIDLLEMQADSSSLATAWNNLARIYHQMGEPGRALELNHKALSISQRMKNDWSIAYVSNSQAEIYLDLGEYETARNYIDQAMKASSRLSSRDVVLYSYRLLAVYHSATGNHQAFLESFGRYESLKDSIFSDETSRALAEMQVMYDIQQKEKENALQRLQITRERSLRNSFLFTSVLVIIMIIVIYRRYHIKQKLNLQLEKQVQLRTADLVQSHEQIDRLNKDLLRNTIVTEERERRRFSEDLHDGLGPLLSAIKIQLELINARKEKEAEREELIQMTRDLIDDAVRSARDIANNLTPNILNDFGLNEALQAHIQKVNTQGSMNIVFLSDIAKTRYRREVELAVYRICLELITNTLKHASATELSLKLKNENEELLIDYHDNGKGYNMNQVASRTEGLGIRNILSRIRSVNGRYEIISAPGMGFRMQISIKP